MSVASATACPGPTSGSSVHAAAETSIASGSWRTTRQRTGLGSCRLAVRTLRRKLGDRAARPACRLQPARPRLPHRASGGSLRTTPPARDGAPHSASSPPAPLWQPQFAAPACDWDDALLSRPESHRADRTAATQHPVLAARDRSCGTSGRPGIAPPVVPGATPAKPTVCGAMGVPPSHPLLGVAPGKLFLPGRVSASHILRRTGRAGPARATARAPGPSGRGPD